MKKRLPKLIDIDELDKKSTRELLGYLKKLHKCEESFSASDLGDDDVVACVEQGGYGGCAEAVWSDGFVGDAGGDRDGLDGAVGFDVTHGL